MRDITERKKAEEELRESEERFRRLVENAPIAMSIINIDGTIEYTNEKHVKVTGYTREDNLTLERWWASVYPDEEYRKDIISKWNAYIDKSSRGEGTGTQERQIVCKDGTIKDIELQFTRVGDKVIVVFNDITERKKAEEAIRLSEEKFSKAFRSSPPWVTISALEDGRYIEVNDTFLRVSGYSKEEVIGCTSIELGIWADPSERAKMVKILHEKGSIYNQEVRFGTKSGEILTMLRSAELIDIGGETCSIAVTLDITERKKLEEQLRQSQKMESIGRLAGGVAHDFNNLLSAIIGYSELTLDNMTDDNPLREHIKTVLDAGVKAETLTNQLLAFSRKQVLEMKVVNLNTIVENMAKILRRVIGEDIVLELYAKPTLRNVRVDPVQIEQILMNLAVNARDAMPSGGHLIIEIDDAELDEKYARMQEGVKPGFYVMIAVTDTGKGISREVQEKIFEPFFSTKGIMGTGLGLSTVYGIIKQHNGNIFVYSELNKGTTFKIYFPVTKEEAEEEEAKDKPARVHGTETVLVVDDEPFICKLVMDSLQPLGYSVMEASSGEEALQISRTTGREIDLLLTDVIMTGMNGKELADAIMKDRPSIKVIFMSGYTNDTIVHQGILYPGENFIHKPLTHKKLMSKLRDVLD
jgi:PAS domain S-box-containing protein